MNLSQECEFKYNDIILPLKYPTNVYKELIENVRTLFDDKINTTFQLETP
jgi:hypothetical protein